MAGLGYVSKRHTKLGTPYTERVREIKDKPKYSDSQPHSGKNPFCYRGIHVYTG